MNGQILCEEMSCGIYKAPNRHAFSLSAIQKVDLCIVYKKFNKAPLVFQTNSTGSGWGGGYI